MIISFPALASFLWYTRRTPHLTLPAPLIPIGRSVLYLGAATEPPKKATQPERSASRCRSTATGSATSALVFSQLLGLGSAEEFHNSELPSPSSALSVVAVVLVAGLVVFGDAYWLCSSVSTPGSLSPPRIAHSLSAPHRALPLRPSSRTPSLRDTGSANLCVAQVLYPWELLQRKALLRSVHLTMCPALTMMTVS